MHDKQTKLVSGYNQLAPFYEVIEWLRFGRELQRARIALLDQLPECNNALFLGDGDGRLLVEFARRQPRCHVTSVDISDAMLAMQRRRVQDLGNIDRFHFIRADVSDWVVPTETFDLVVSAFHLDCFTENEVHALIARLTPILHREGCWYIVDFAIPPAGWKRCWARVWSAIMIRFFRFQTGLQIQGIIDFREVFETHRWTLIAEYESRSGFQFAVILRKPLYSEFP